MHIDIYKESYYKELAPAIIEAEKSQELQLSSWRPVRAEGISFSSKSSRLNNQEKLVFQSEFKGQKRPKSQAVREKFPPAFCPIQGWMGSTCIREGLLLYAVYRCKCQFHPKNILTDIPRIMCDEMSGHFLAQSAWHIKLIITGTHCCCYCCSVASVVSDSVWPHRRQPTRLPHPWDSPDKNTGVGCHFLLQCMKGKRESEVAQSCPTLSDPMDCSPLGSSVHGIFQTRVLKWGAIAFSAGTHYSITNIICNTKELKTISLSIHSTSIH